MEVCHRHNHNRITIHPKDNSERETFYNDSFKLRVYLRTRVGISKNPMQNPVDLIKELETKT